MKNLKKFACALLVMILLFSMIIPVTAAKSGLALNKKTATVYVGNSMALKLTGTVKFAIWSSSNKKIATVSRVGKVTAKKAGKATVTAKSGRLSAKCVITVKNPSLSKKSVTLNPGKSITVKINGRKIKSVKSSNKSVATVTKAGKITAKKVGKATVTFTDNKSKKYACKVQVVAASSVVKNADSLSWNQLVSQMPSSLRGTTLTFYNWNPIKEFTGAEAVITRFQKQTGIKVNWVTGGYDDYDSRIAAMVNSGNSPDVIRFRDANIHRMYLCQDIKSATGYDFSGKIWDKKISDYYTVKNKVYAVNRKDTLFNQPFVLIYRKSMIEKYKLDDPYVMWKKGKWTWDEFINVLKQYKLFNQSDFYPWCTNMGIDYLYFTGVSLITFDGAEFKNNLKDPRVTNAVKKMCDYRKAEYIGSAMRDYRGFEAGSCLFLTFSAICTRKTNAWFTDTKKDGNLYCVPIPKISGAENIQYFSEIEAYGICKGAKNGPAAYYFLRYFLDADNYDTNTFFCNEQAAEVYKASMAKSKYFTCPESALLDAAGKEGGNLAGLSNWVIHGGDFAQYTTERNRVNGDFDLAVKKANQLLAKFK